MCCGLCGNLTAVCSILSVEKQVLSSEQKTYEQTFGTDVVHIVLWRDLQWWHTRVLQLEQFDHTMALVQ